MDNMEALYSELRKKNLRITKQRKAIINILKGRHLTIQEIYDELKNLGMNNLATVYNNVNFLLRHEIITSIYSNGITRYDLAVSDSIHDAKNHIHISCDNCSNLIEFEDKELMELIKKHPKFSQFNIDNIHIMLTGSCMNKKNDNKCNRENCCVHSRK